MLEPMRRQLKQMRPSARPPARLEPDPQTSALWTSQTCDEVAALLVRIDRLIGLRETD